MDIVQNCLFHLIELITCACSLGSSGNPVHKQYKHCTLYTVFNVKLQITLFTRLFLYKMLFFLVKHNKTTFVHFFFK